MPLLCFESLKIASAVDAVSAAKNRPIEPSAKRTSDLAISTLDGEGVILLSCRATNDTPIPPRGMAAAFA